MLLGAAILLMALAACSGNSESERSDPERGASIYAANCQTCHGEAATGQQASPSTPTRGPEGHSWHHADGQLVQIIFGRLQFPGRTMPSFEGKLSEKEVLDVLAYLKSNWPTEQRQFQAEASENWLILQETNQ
ncbi:MAG: hypothetical protein BZY79_01465 [SAR202 cluster bacterium Casp-Chloro-G4]|nr:cytochrome c [Chloroflexota bacterium]MDA1227647.1 cytochrome c [Chloroflexota bacterium]PKB61907.1 MAG: hypothetical protein BZY79_01465 [SAR202 cluster bacterium Casp-Chloro-G4]